MADGGFHEIDAVRVRVRFCRAPRTAASRRAAQRMHVVLVFRRLVIVLVVLQVQSVVEDERTILLLQTMQSRNTTIGLQSAQAELACGFRSGPPERQLSISPPPSLRNRKWVVKWITLVSNESARSARTCRRVRI